MRQLIAWCMSALFCACRLFPQQRKIALLSRQSNHPFDFMLLEPALREAFPGWSIEWACECDTGSLGAGTVLRQMWHAATASICIVDGYVPAVSIPYRHKRAYVMQMWHAMGAIKKFGYQALDTSDGRSSRDAAAFSMHRGYDVVVAGTCGAVEAYAQAFDYPREAVVPLGLPRVDYLLAPEFAAQREQGALRAARRIGLDALRKQGRKVVLYAPTLRRGNRYASTWLGEYAGALGRALALEGPFALVVSGHPLDQERGQDQQPSETTEGAPQVRYLYGVPTRDALWWADYVVTDYSAVAFEAALVGAKVLFYLPDLGEYRKSPGLNIDPLTTWPDLAFQDADALARRIAQDVAGDAISLFDEQAGDYLGALAVPCIPSIIAALPQGK